MISDAHANRFINLARALFPTEMDFKSFHVTIVLRKNKILTIATNHKKTHPRTHGLNYKFLNCGLHSEMRAVIRLGRSDCFDLTFVNVRINKNGQIVDSKPCCGCQSLLKQVGYKKVYHTDENGKFSLWID